MCWWKICLGSIKKINLYRDAIFCARHIQLVKSNWWLLLPSDQFIFEIPKQFHSRILNNFLVMDFCYNNFSEIYLHNVLYHLMLIQEIAVNCSQPFEQNFLLDRVFFEKLSRVHF